MNFRQYFEEANIQRLTQEEETQVKKIANILWDKWKDLKPENLPKLKTQAISKDGYELIQVATLDYGRRDFKNSRYKQKVLPVYVNVSDDAGASGAFIPHKNPKDDYIFIDHTFLSDSPTRSKLLSLMSHEAIHAVQHYRKMSSEYIKASNKDVENMTFEDWVDYYSEPLEKEAIFSEMDTFIRSQYTLLIPNPDNSDSINDYLNRNREKFLLELNLFAKYPLQNYIINKELPLPHSLLKFEHFLTTILERSSNLKKVKTSPNIQKKLQALRKEFKSKLLSIVSNLNKQEDNSKSTSPSL